MRSATLLCTDITQEYNNGSTVKDGAKGPSSFSGQILEKGEGLH